MLRDVQHNLDHDIHEILHTFRHNYKKHNIPTNWASIPQDNSTPVDLRQHASSSMGPQIKNVDIYNPQRHRFLRGRHFGPQPKEAHFPEGYLC
jgi:hypothetical protein